MYSSRGVLLFLILLFGTNANHNPYQNAERRRWIPIKSCSQQTPYDGYECAKAHDGILVVGRNGWSFKQTPPPNLVGSRPALKGVYKKYLKSDTQRIPFKKSSYQLPQWVEFTLRGTSKVNHVAIKSLWDGGHYRPKGFKIELNKGGKWITPQKVRLEHTTADINGGVINLREKQDEIDVAFKEEVDIDKVKITFTESFDNSIVINEILIQYVPEWQKCNTVGGTQRNRECIFPFVNPWTKAVHYACSTDFGLPPWCATRVNSDLTMSKYTFSGFCNSSCEVEEVHTCYTMFSSTRHEIYVNEKSKERRNCVFPFEYKGKWYTECTNYGEIPMCATVVANNGTLLDYGYCGPECPGSTVSSQCVAATGFKSSKGQRCVFPYQYKEKYYYSCEDGEFPGRSGKMCATGINHDTIQPLKGQWGFCSDTEPCDKNECITVGGPHVGQACRFPFENKWTKELHWGCTTASLEQEVGHKYTYASAPWCATDTTAGDEMVAGKWGFCSKKCSIEKGSNCYVADGTSMSKTRKCIFPFVFNGLVNKQCTYVKGYLMCPIKVNNDGLAVEADMRRCGPSPSCFNSTTINGNAITIGYQDVGSYANDGSKPLNISFSFETGVEDSSESNWNVEASVTAGFDAFGVSLEASVTAGGGGGASSSSSSHQSHSLTYSCPPHTRVVLSQQVLSSGVFESRSFKLILTENKIGADRKEEPTVRELKWQEISKNIKSRKLD